MRTLRQVLHLCFACLIGAPGILYARTEPVPNYRDSLANTTDHILQMRYYAALGESVFLSSPDSALYFFELGDSIAQLVPNEKRNAFFYSNYAPLLNNTAFVVQKQGDIVRAVNLYERCIDVQRTGGDTAGLGSSYLNLGKLYSEAGEYDLALMYYGLAKKTMPGDELVGQAHCQNGIGKVLFSQGKNEAALNCYYSALNMFQQAQHVQGQTRTLINMGELYFQQKQLSAAHDCFTNALALALSEENLQGQADAYYYLGEISWRNNLSDSAAFYGETSLALSRELGFPRNLRNASSLLFRVYQSEGKSEAALSMHILLSEMNDSLNNVDKNNAIVREKLKAEYERRTSELNAAQERKTAIASEEARHQRTVNYFTFAALFLAVGLLVVAVRSYRNKKKAHEDISTQKSLVEEKNKNITDSIRYASHLQKALMPQDNLLKPYAQNAFIFFQPKDIVSGDFFWSIAINNYLYIAVCDSTGHGVPGAFVSLLNMSFIKEAINEKQLSGPAAIFDFVRERLVNSFQHEQSQDGMDGILLRIDLKDISRSVYAAANNSPVIIRNTITLDLPADKMAVGKSLVDTKSFTEFPLPLEPGDLLVTYTDGFPDQFGGPKGKKYKYKNLNRLLAEQAGKDGNAVHLSLQEEFFRWKGDLEQTDDVLICGIQF